MYSFFWLSVMAAMLGASSVYAAVTADEAKQLNSELLTPWGAEKAGNKEGTIPAWSGERVMPPADYDPKDRTRRPAPWKEKPLYSITGQNMDKYADRLTEGQKAMLRQYPTYRLDVYPTHRTANYPKYVLENTIKNSTSCKALENGLVLQGCYGGFPFPLPKTGNEVMWNHSARFIAYSWSINGGSYIVDTKGTPILQSYQNARQMAPFYDPDRRTAANGNDIYYQLRSDQSEPPRVAGQKLLIIDALDSVNVGRRVWQYIPGQRRVKLAPDLSYDTPNPVSGGSTTMDEVTGFYGPQDRFDFKLIGKSEKYLMYNNYEMTDYKACPNEKQLTKNFMNPDCVRWELHRVWVVQATLKPGYRHILPKRIFYWDEDTYGAGTTDDYDASGRLYRVVNIPSFQLYEMAGIQATVSDATLSNDLQTGIWAATVIFGEKGWGHAELPPPTKDLLFT